MTYDFIVIGAGLAGASAASELAGQGKVLLVEAEAQPGYHSSGRSAALFTRNYGTATVRRVNALSEAFFRHPPAGFTAAALLQPRGALAVAAAGFEAELDAILSLTTSADPVVELAVADALSIAPFLRPERVARAVYEPGVTDIDVAALLQAYLREFRQRHGTIVTGEPVTGLYHRHGNWTVTTCRNTWITKTLINAAGAWADEIAALAGALPIGLIARRRTAIIVDATPGYEVGSLPCVDFAGSDAYIKPDAGRLMASPGDATPVAPQDVQPDEMDVAVLVDWIERETLISVRQIAHRWAGLRSFVADNSPVVGYDPSAPDFFWLAAQGGFGIMMAPALARATASVCLTGKLPEDFTASGLVEADLGPGRPGLARMKLNAVSRE